MDRRDFIMRVGMGAATFSMIDFLMSCQKTNNVTPNVDFMIDLTSSQFLALNDPGGFAISNNIIIAQDLNGNFLAVSDICTHAGCSVTYQSGQNQFFCPCHGSIFNSSGGVLQGPASSPLTQYNVTRSGNSLHVFS